MWILLKSVSTDMAVQVLGYEVVDTRELYERYNMGQADEATVKNTPFYCLLKVRIYNKDCDLGEEGVG